MWYRSRLAVYAAIVGVALGIAYYVGSQKKRVWRTGELAPIVRVKDTATACYRGTRSITFWYTHSGQEFEVNDSIGCRDEIHDPAVAVFDPAEPTKAYLLTEPRRKIREGND